MRRRYLGILFHLLWSLSLGCSPSSEEPAATTSATAPSVFCDSYTTEISHTAIGGTGTEQDPYLICNSAQLLNLAAASADWNKFYKLKSDLDLTGVNWAPLGSTQIAPGVIFTGGFDGDNHIISNLSINAPTSSIPVGFFSTVGAGSALKNIILTNVNIIGNKYVGALIGAVSGGSHTNLSVTSGTVSGTEYVGGLVGTFNSQNSDFIIISKANAHVTVNATGSGDGNAGGLFGAISMLNNSSITRSYSTGNVTSVKAAGGFAGSIVSLAGNPVGTISDCYSKGNVTATDASAKAGGFTALGLSFNLANSYSTGIVTSPSSSRGGFIGEFYLPTVFNSVFWDSSVNDPGLPSIGNTTTTGLTPATTAQLTSQSTFTGWDFSTLWDIQEGVSYPDLR